MANQNGSGFIPVQDLMKQQNNTQGQSGTGFVPVQELMKKSRQESGGNGGSSGFVPVQELMKRNRQQTQPAAGTANYQTPVISAAKQTVQKVGSAVASIVGNGKVAAPASSLASSFSGLGDVIPTNVDADTINGYFEKTNKFLTRASEDQATENWEIITDPGSAQERQQMMKELPRENLKLRMWFAINKDYIDEETYNTYMGYLDEAEKSVKAASQFYETVGSFGSQEEYKTALNQQRLMEQYMDSGVLAAWSNLSKLQQAGASESQINGATATLQRVSSAVDLSAVMTRLQEMNSAIEYAQLKGEDTTVLEQERDYLKNYCDIVQLYKGDGSSGRQLTDLGNALYTLSQSSDMGQFILWSNYDEASFYEDTTHLSKESLEAADKEARIKTSMVSPKMLDHMTPENEQFLKMLDEATSSNNPVSPIFATKDKPFVSVYERVYKEAEAVKKAVENQTHRNGGTIYPEYVDTTGYSEQEMQEYELWKQWFEQTYMLLPNGYYYHLPSGNVIDFMGQKAGATRQNGAINIDGVKVAQITEDGGIEFEPDFYKEEQTENPKWFNAGAFADGFQVSDLATAPLGTLGDIGLGLIKGAGEGLENWAKGMMLMGLARTKGSFSEKQQDRLRDHSVRYGNIVNTEKLSSEWVNQNSALGQKMDEVIQSGGQLLSQMGLQALGVPWWMTTAAMTYGGDAVVAYQSGATAKQAVLSGMIAAGAEIFSEKMFGGFKFQGKGWGDAVTSAISRGIANKTLRTLTSFGLDVAEEGVEELVSGYLSSLGHKLTYAKEKDMDELFSSEDKWDAFIGGTLLSFIGNFGRARKAFKKVNSIDYNTGLTDSEYKLANEIYTQGLEQTAQSGKKLSLAEKAIMFDDAVELVKNMRKPANVKGLTTEITQKQMEQTQPVADAQQVAATQQQVTNPQQVTDTQQVANAQVQAQAFVGQSGKEWNTQQAQLLAAIPDQSLQGAMDKFGKQALTFDIIDLQNDPQTQQAWIDAGLTWEQLGETYMEPDALRDEYARRQTVRQVTPAQDIAQKETPLPVERETALAFVGQSGQSWDERQAQLLAAIPNDVLLQTADKLGKQTLTFDIVDLQNDPQTQQAWIDAGLTWEQLGETYITYEALNDEIMRRATSPQPTPAATSVATATQQPSDVSNSFQDVNGEQLHEQEKRGINTQLRLHEATLNAMDPVADITVPADFWKWSKDQKQNWIIERLRPTGYQVDRKGFGTIQFPPKRLRRAFNYLRIGESSETAFEALPAVFTNGIEIDGHINHKGREYKTVTIAAPIIVNGMRGNLAAVVMKTSGNFYKMHRLLSPDGTMFVFQDKEIEAESTPGGGVTENGSLATPINSASENRIAQEAGGVKGSNLTESYTQEQSTAVTEKAYPAPKGTGSLRLEHGLVPVTQELWDEMKNIVEMTGQQVVLYYEEATENGVHDGYEKGGVLHVNVNGANPVAWTFGHEFVHTTEGTKEHEMLKKFALSRIERTGGNLKQLRQEKRQLYKQNGVQFKYDAEGRQKVDNELVAAYVGRNLFTDEQSIREMAEYDPTLGQRFLRWIDGILGAFGNRQAAERHFLHKTRLLLQKALNGQTTPLKAKQKTVPTTGTSYDAIEAERHRIDGLYDSGQITDEEYDNAMEALDEEELLQSGRVEINNKKKPAAPAASNTETPDNGVKHSYSNVQEVEVKDIAISSEDGSLVVNINSRSSGLHKYPKGQWAKQLAKAIRTELSGKSIYAADGDIITVTNRGVSELTYGKRTQDLYEHGKETGDFSALNEKQIASEHVASLIALSKYDAWSENDDPDDSFKKDGLCHRKVIAFIDGEPYYISILTALNGDPNQYADYGEKFYDIESIDKIEHQTSRSALSETGTKVQATSHKIKMADGMSDKLTVAQKNRIVNNQKLKYSVGNSSEKTAMQIALEEAQRKKQANHSYSPDEKWTETNDSKTASERRAAEQGYPIIGGRQIVPNQSWVLVENAKLDKSGNPVLTKNGQQARYHSEGKVVGMTKDGRLIILLKSNRRIAVEAADVTPIREPVQDSDEKPEEYYESLVNSAPKAKTGDSVEAETSNGDAGAEDTYGDIVHDEKEYQAARSGFPILHDVQVVPYKTWVNATDPGRNNYGLVVGRAVNNKLVVSFWNKKEGVRKRVAIAYEHLRPVDAIYQMPVEEYNALMESVPENIDEWEMTDEERKAINELLKRAWMEEFPESEKWTPKKREELSGKVRAYLTHVETEVKSHIEEALKVPKGVSRESLKPIVQQISDEYLRTGTVSQETVDRLFDEAYENGVVEDREYFDQYKHIKDHLRTTAVTLSQQDQPDIVDFDEFRKQARRLLKIKDEGGLPVGSAYQELNDMAPELFPENITHPADQLQRMYEVADGIRIREQSLNEAHSEDAAEFKTWARNDFDCAVWDYVRELNKVHRYAQRETQANQAGITTPEQAVKAWAKLKSAGKKVVRVMRKNLLTESDKEKVDALLRGEKSRADLNPAEDNVKGILAVYKAKQEYEHINYQLSKYKRLVKAKYRALASSYLKNIDNWKDKRFGLLYSRETMPRNIEKIVPDPDLAAAINEEYFYSVNRAEAQSTRMKNKYRNRVRELHLSRKVAKGNLVSEAHAVQLYGEAVDNIRVLESKRVLQTRDGKTREEWQAVVQKLWAENPNLEKAKIEKAVEEFRKIYDELFQRMNEVRVSNGYEPVNYRNGYFPHFQPGEEGLVANFGKVFGIEQVDILPSTINGQTYMFRPGIQWFGNAQERLGFNTAYDAVEGFDKYIEGIANVIHHTDGIQKLRALATEIRYMASDKGIRKKIDEIEERKDLDDEEKRQMISSHLENAKFNLSNFVVELDEYANLLAGKKSRRDRNAETDWGRAIYNFSRKWETRVAANMVGGNLGSAIMNLVPLHQAWGRFRSSSMLHGLWRTMFADMTSKEVTEFSDFLTSRRGGDVLAKGGVDKFADAIGKPSEWIDTFVSGWITRAAYYENIKQGLSHTEAIHQADIVAARIMADRSKGAMPTLFAARNPLTKGITRFQLEVNNQISEIIRDIPYTYIDDKFWVRIGKVSVIYTRYFLGACMLNLIFKAVCGRTPAIDPFGLIADLIIGMIRGDDTEEILKDLGTEVLGYLPFTSALNLFGLEVDSRFPVASSFPDLAGIVSDAKKGDWEGVAFGFAEPILYGVNPLGGGGQVLKTWKGISAFAKGGSYTKDKDGNDILQYPIFKDDGWDFAGNLAKATLLGKNSTPEAQEWVDSGFKSLSAKDTALYQGLLEEGVGDRDAYDLIQQYIAAEDDEKKRDIIIDADIDDDAKIIMVGAMLGTEMKTKSGNPSAYAKFLTMIDQGMSVDEYLEIKNEGGNVYKYLDFAEAGLHLDLCDDLTIALGALEPEQGKKQVSNHQKWRAVIQTVDDQEQQLSALSVLMGEDQFAKCSVAYDYEINPEVWVMMQEVLPLCDEDENGSYSQYEIKLAIDAVDGDLGSIVTAGWWGIEIADKYSRLSKKEKAVLWQLLTGSKSAENNPYDTKTGKKVLKAYEDMRESQEDED